MKKITRIQWYLQCFRIFGLLYFHGTYVLYGTRSKAV